jgi:hypothetical protein
MKGVLHAKLENKARSKERLRIRGEGDKDGVKENLTLTLLP